jgi:hypothetical protein
MNIPLLTFMSSIQQKNFNALLQKKSLGKLTRAPVRTPCCVDAKNQREA